MTDAAIEYLARFDTRLLSTPEGRRVLSSVDPMLFALLYLRHHLKSDATGGEITLSEFHYALCEDALQWLRAPAGPRENRKAYVAPRSCGKSTWAFLILPLWAAAHGHKKFAAAFAHSAGQAEQHLQTFRHELDANELLRKDFPELCSSAVRANAGFKLADNRSMIQQANGFIFAAKGIDSGNLGMKVGEHRPDLIILDDIEPGEESYSAGQASKRLTTLTDVVLPLNDFATVVVVGTVTMPGSIIHQLVRTVTSLDQPEQWISAENVTCHYFPAIMRNEDGTERSIWPAKWSLEWLQDHRGERSFMKNMQNDPIAMDGAYWTMEDFKRGPVQPDATRWLLSVDPAVTTKTTSDFTGLAVIAASRKKDVAVVVYAEERRVTGAALRERVLELLDRFPEIGLVYIETNQGGDTWKDTLHTLPVRLETVHQTVKKETRAAQALNMYQRGRVLHLQGAQLQRLEEQMVAFPKAPHDDMVDAVGSGLLFLLAPGQALKPGARVGSYV